MPERPPFFPYGDENEDNAWQRDQHASHSPQQPDTSESPRYRPGIGDVTYPCPSCESFRTEQRHIARRICSAVGAAAGATSAVAASLSGAEAGAVIGALGGPIGAVCGGIAGAVLTGLLAGAAGCTTGAALGEALDLKVLNNWRCLACGRTFTVHLD
ncbi:hypothetical protein [Burkholderia ubonensis]|uniref:hypothetical protein n=1 Tax=Burkholderia ubonensis TaxID=101571 RepID=UPI0009B469B8|nr:hypothetical protein [Burkholderia ubonensis]